MTPDALRAFAFVAISHLHHAPPEPIAREHACAIAEAVEDERALWDVPDDAATLALVAIDRTESDFDPRVATCERRGKLGEIGAFQVMPGAAPWPAWLVCSDVSLQARSAIAVLRRCREHGARSAGGMMRCYAAGDGSTDSENARNKIGLLWTLSRRYGVAMP